MIRATALVSGGGANLQAILDAGYFREIENFKLGAVIASAPGVYALERAANAHIPAYVVERALFPNRASFCNALLNKLRDLDTDLVIAAGFTEKLNYPLLHFYRNRIINAQPALLPAFCDHGFDPVHTLGETIRLGVRISGATAYFMSEEDDGTGPIIVQQAVKVKPDDTMASLQERIMQLGEWVVLPEAIRLYCQGRLEVRDGKVIIKE